MCEMGWSGQRDTTPCLQPQSHIHPTLDHVGGLAFQGGDTTPHRSLHGPRKIDPGFKGTTLPLLRQEQGGGGEGAILHGS